MLVVSCNKTANKLSLQNDLKLNATSLALTNLSTFFNAPYINYDSDSIERITVLGVQLTKPYLIPNITQACHNLGIYTVPVVVTNLYVRYNSANTHQLAPLDATMELQNLELFDTPADYDIITGGYYYEDLSIPREQITWQYAVVPPNFQFPAGIQYEILARDLSPPFYVFAILFLTKKYINYETT